MTAPVTSDSAMRVLVTGATGFIGRYLTERLCQQGYCVRALCRDVQKAAFLERLGAEVVCADITNYSQVEAAMQGCQQVYHLAAVTSRTATSKARLYDINVTGTENVARAAIATKITRLVYGSSAGVYGIIAHPPANELTQTRPNTPYRESKRLGEKILMSYHRNANLPVAIARLSTVLGVGSLGWLGLCQKIAAGNFRLIGNGDNYLHTTHVLDSVEGLWQCAHTPGIEGQCYVIAHKQPTQLSRMVALIAQSLDVSLANWHLPRLPFQLFFSTAQLTKTLSGLDLPKAHRYEMFLASRVLNIQKAEIELGYNPAISPENALKETVQWYRDTGKL